MDMVKSRKCLQVWQIAKINLRHNFILHFALAVVLLVITPVLFGISNLDNTASAVPLEAFVSLIGVILLTPIFQPEQNQQIEEITASKYVSNISVYVIRIVYSVISLILLISLFVIFMRAYDCNVTLSLMSGTVATAMFIGSLGLLTASLSNNIAVSYMVPLLYYAMNFAGGSKLGNFYLFSMMGGEYKQKIWLFGASIILITLSVLAKWILKKFR